MKSRRKTVITVGTFDGVHLGHQAILREVRRISQLNGLEAVAYAFSFPPRFQTPGPYLILTPRMKSILLLRYVTRVLHAEFPRVRALSPEEFVHRVLCDELQADTVVVGDNFRFGANRLGDAELLKELGEIYGFSVIIMPPVIVDGKAVSSTRIRELISAGEVEMVTRLLGRPLIIVGEVIPGDRIGSKIGYPTANLSLARELIRPGSGIYLCYAFWDKEGEGGLLYIGNRPTISGTETRFELHLLSSPSCDLTGKTLEVHLLSRLRDDRKFPSLTALREQISSDVASARALLPSYPPPEPILSSA